MNKILVILTFFFLVGCGTNQPVVTTYTFHTELDPAWTLPCITTPPPAKDEYRIASDSERAMMMGLSYIDQVEAVTKCNTRLKEIRLFNERSIKHNVEELKRMKNE